MIWKYECECVKYLNRRSKYREFKTFLSDLATFKSQPLQLCIDQFPVNTAIGFAISDEQLETNN